jgi:hypothetical protein
MKEIKYTILYCAFVRTFVITFVIPFYYGSGTIINYGSGSDFLTSYGSDSGSTRQKVMVPTVPVPVQVPQHCLDLSIINILIIAEAGKIRVFKQTGRQEAGRQTNWGFLSQ